MPESRHRDSADIGPGGILDIGIIFASAFPHDSNVESRLRLTGPSGVISEARHHILKEDVPVWKRWGMLCWKNISRINQLSLIQYLHATKNREYRKRLIFKKDFFYLCMLLGKLIDWVEKKRYVISSMGACVLFLFFYWFLNCQNPEVKNLPSNTRDTGMIPGQGTKVPHVTGS